ncbi:MAG TPA: hypothetical protein PLD25_19775 [Chloroflexota bacterium]|nr:hypothetical protein [Chloroflexota bacterium]HUM70663.1 hypothetical protein [Chloroflexota bacterium]
MSRAESKASLPSWIRQKLAALRQQASEPDQWPETADQLLTRLVQQTPIPETEESDMDMFSLAVHDTLAGIDISERYPMFFEKMLASPSLYEAFLEALDVLEADGRHELPPVPATSASALTFLRKEPASQPLITPTPGDRWQVTWKVLVAQLQQLFFPTTDFVYRRAAPLLEDESIILLHDEVMIDQQLVETMLEAIRPVGQPEILRLQLMAAGEAPLPPLQASLHWGVYAHTAVLDAYGRAHFPPLSLDDLLDATGQLRAADLHLILESPQT